MSWIEIRALFDSPPEDWSPYVDALLKHGIENSMQSDAPPTLTACLVEVEGADRELEGLRAELLGLGAAAVETRPYEERNWEEDWKKFFKPRRVGRRFIVRPTWEEFAAEPDDLVITLDPGQAFGTGDHPTTRMCLELLEEAGVGAAKVIDVGCGSGILSIGAKLLGAREVIAIDVEPLSVEVARENAELNGVDIECRAGNGLEGVAEVADAILSNIISAALIRIAPDATRALKAGGRWLVSGILEDNWPEVLACAESYGFRLNERREEDGWVAATFLR